ncbi:MAG: FeoB-associated Cys-rich membrane protein [Verrucomicrobiaceae bacterium]|nr:FeoB-associated Cys-rich membrane protein [Verrucomicrobiaceae bacterium]
MIHLFAQAPGEDWQAKLAPIIVALVVVIFIARRIWRSKKGQSGCGGACDCSLKPKPK